VVRGDANNADVPAWSFSYECDKLISAQKPSLDVQRSVRMT